MRIGIRSCVQEATHFLEKTYATGPLHEKDLSPLQNFSEELLAINGKVHTASIPKLIGTINKTLERSLNLTSFKRDATFLDKLSILLDNFSNFFVGKIREAINKNIFYSWEQKNRFDRALKEADKPGSSPKKTSAEKFIQSYIAGLESGQKTRDQMQNIGGARVTIETKDGEKLDGMYLSAQNFFKKCEDAGANQGRLKVGENHINGLVFEKEHPLLKDLTELKLFGEIGEKGAGWSSLAISEKIFIMPDFAFDDLQNKGFIQKDTGTLAKDALFSLVANPLPSIKGGTVLLSTATASTYEMHKREAMALLMQGVNVMLFNYRGYGISTGKPSEQGTYEDIEAVYDYLSQKQHVTDENLVCRGYCLSGGIVAKLTQKHPKIHTIFDQTYADIRDIVFKTVMDSVKDIIKYDPKEVTAVKEAILWLLRPLINLLVLLMSPAYNVSSYIKHMQGNTLILRATEDSYVTEEMTDKLIQNAGDKKVDVGYMPGIHGTSWLDAKTSTNNYPGRYHILQFLQKNGISNTAIDGGSSLAHATIDQRDYESKSASLLEATLDKMPSDPQHLPGELLERPLGDLKLVAGAHTTTTSQLPAVVFKPNYFQAVLEEADRLKERLGGGEKLVLSTKVSFIFGVPTESAKAFFRMVLQKKWMPAFFWTFLAKLFKVTSNQLTPYEKACQYIQHFGLVVANKERFLEICDTNQKERFNEFPKITQLAWHPKQNSLAIEKAYIEFTEYFLTKHFQQAQESGDDALIDYFKAFDGVCFEDRMRELETYSRAHPLEENEASAVADWDGTMKVATAFERELQSFGATFKGEDFPAEALEKHFKKKGILHQEFTKDGEKVKPSATEMHKWILSMIDAYAVAPYSLESFLQHEYAIFLEEYDDKSMAAFKAYLQTRTDKNQGFDLNNPEIDSVLQRLKVT